MTIIFYGVVILNESSFLKAVAKLCWANSVFKKYKLYVLNKDEETFMETRSGVVSYKEFDDMVRTYEDDEGTRVEEEKMEFDDVCEIFRSVEDVHTMNFLDIMDCPKLDVSRNCLLNLSSSKNSALETKNCGPSLSKNQK
jgi:hypothetical protein